MGKLKINFDLCVQRMESRKTCYLEQVRAQRRCAFTRLTNRLTEMKRRTQEQFTKFADASELNKDWDQEVEAESKKEDININITKLLEAAEERSRRLSTNGGTTRRTSSRIASTATPSAAPSSTTATSVSPSSTLPLSPAIASTGTARLLPPTHITSAIKTSFE